MILTLDNTTWFFVIVFNPFYVCFEPFGFRFHTLYDLIMSSEIPYHVEGDCGVPALSDASGTQSENPKSAEVDMPYVLKLSMGFGKLPLPNKNWSAKWSTHTFACTVATWKVSDAFAKLAIAQEQKMGYFFGLNAKGK
jgi:hypothetical protein